MLNCTYPWTWNGFKWFLATHLFHSVVIFLLIFCHEHLEGTSCLFLLFVKVIDDHTNEQIKGKKRSKYNEEYKIEIHVDVRFTNWLFVELQTKKKEKENSQKYDDFSIGKSLILTHTHLPRVDGIVHDLNPSFERSHLKQA